MTKGKDVKQLYSKLGLHPTDYQEVRADEEVTRSIEERWPLLRDLLSSLAQSLESDTGGQQAVRHQVPEPDQPAQASVSPSAAIPQSPTMSPPESAVPPAPSWLQQSEVPPAQKPRPAAREPQVEPPPRPQSNVAETSDTGESLAERLERLYGHSAPAEADEEGEEHGRTDADEVPAEASIERTADEGKSESNLPPSGITDFEEGFGEDAAAASKANDSSLLGRLLARPTVEAAEPVRSPEPEVLSPSGWRFTSEPDAPPAADAAGDREEASPAAPSTSDPELSEILHRLTPTDESDEPETGSGAVDDDTSPKKDLQSMFARLKKGGGQ